VICGAALIASWDPLPQGPRVERHVLVKRARLSGLLIFDYAHRFEEEIARLADWVRQGKLRYREDVEEGIEALPRRHRRPLPWREPW
jgi:NADPH-dependent curcumin reductase CurA